MMIFNDYIFIFNKLMNFVIRVIFFFQAEDGIRDVAATGVQTCALPISLANRELADPAAGGAPEWPFALRGSAEAALAHRAETLLAAGDLDAAVALARRARSLGLAVLASPAGAPARQSVSATVLRAVRRAVTGESEGTEDPSKAALDTL